MKEATEMITQKDNTENAAERETMSETENDETAGKAKKDVRLLRAMKEEGAREIEAQVEIEGR